MRTFDNTDGDREMIVRRTHKYGDEPAANLFIAPGATLQASTGVYDYEITQPGVTPPAADEGTDANGSPVS
jgi:hypothetical protein